MELCERRRAGGKETRDWGDDDGRCWGRLIVRDDQSRSLCWPLLEEGESHYLRRGW